MKIAILHPHNLRGGGRPVNRRWVCRPQFMQRRFPVSNRKRWPQRPNYFPACKIKWSVPSIKKPYLYYDASGSAVGWNCVGLENHDMELMRNGSGLQAAFLCHPS